MLKRTLSSSPFVSYSFLNRASSLENIKTSYLLQEDSVFLEEFPRDMKDWKLEEKKEEKEKEKEKETS